MTFADILNGWQVFIDANILHAARIGVSSKVWKFQVKRESIAPA
jgi:hypothetical protein